MKRKVLLTIISLLILNYSNAQTGNSKHNWKANISESKVFIENKGQFDGKGLNPQAPVLFGVDNMGYEIYFTPQGLSYRFAKAEKMTRQEEAQAEREDRANKNKFENEKREHEGKKKIVITYTINMEWVGANPSVQITGEHGVAEYFTYSNPQHIEQSVNHASAFSKITYHNLYAGIDAEYVFHQTEGIKYNLVIHPGADASQIKMKYSGADKVSIDRQGNVIASVKNLAITDHAPQTFYQTTHAAIASSYEMKGDEIAFHIPEYDRSQAIVIDPWTTVVTTLITNNRAFDIGKDAAGNVFIGGGKGNGAGYKVAKYSSTGSLVWTNHTTLTGYWGDMVTDTAGNCYVSEGAFLGNILKVNAAGVIAWTTTIPASNAYEAWALAVNECNAGQIIVSYYDGGYRVRLANLNLATGAITGANAMGLTQPKEIRSLCIAPNGDVHGLTFSIVGGGTGGNYIFGGTNTFTQKYLIANGYTWDEISPLYSNTNVYTGSGVNGIVADNCNVYTTNGVVLQKRNAATGVIMGSVSVPGGIFERNGGIAVDDCGNLYVGSQGGVYKFDNALTQTGFAATTAAVYDVRISSTAGEVLACGDGFVASLSLTACASVSCGGLNVTVSPSSSSVCNGGSTMLTASGASTYSWSPATGLSATTGAVVTANPTATTTYTITGSTSGCVSLSDTATVTITISPNTPLNFTRDYYICGESGGTVQLTASGGTSYTWTPGATLDDSTIANPLANPFITTTYTVTVANGSCKDTALVTIHLVSSPTPPTISQSGDSIWVTQNYVHYQWYFNGIPMAGDTLFYLIVKQTGQYSCYVTDSLGCKVITPGILVTGAAESNGIEGIKIHPNPIKNELIVTGYGQSVTTMDIYNAIGEVVLTHQLSSANKTVIDVHTLPSGIYYIQMENIAGKWNGRFVKQ